MEPSQGQASHDQASSGPASSGHDPLLTEFFAVSDEPCPACGYSLHRVKTDTCPECGSGLRLTVGQPLPPLAPWTFAIVSFAMGLGFDLVVTVLMGVGFAASWLLWSSPPLWPVIFMPIALTVAGGICVVGIWSLLRYRATWTRARLGVQWARAVGLFFAVGFAHAFVGVMIVVVVR